MSVPPVVIVSFPQNPARSTGTTERYSLTCPAKAIRMGEHVTFLDSPGQSIAGEDGVLLLYEPQFGLSAPRHFRCSYLTNCRYGGRPSPLQASTLIICLIVFVLAQI